MPPFPGLLTYIAATIAMTEDVGTLRASETYRTLCGAIQSLKISDFLGSKNVNFVLRKLELQEAEISAP